MALLIMQSKVLVGGGLESILRIESIKDSRIIHESEECYHDWTMPPYKGGILQQRVLFLIELFSLVTF